MADLEEIAENPRTGEGDDSSHGDGRDWNNVKRSRSSKRQNSGGSRLSVQTSPPVQDPEGVWEEEKEEGGAGQTAHHQADWQTKDVLDHRTEFYKGYRIVAEQYDTNLLKKHDQDLNTILVFAGLFSAIASAFIIQVDSRLQPDPNDQTAALLRVLIYKIDNSTFGNDVPTLPHWAGPPRAIVHVQAILFASLSVTLFSAFLAMLARQWLNHYGSADLRGTAIERIQTKQRKLDGFNLWSFDSMMESLSQMLQLALLLFGCALSRYLWEVDVTIASVVLGVTSFGVLVYISLVIAGATFDSCPYQTPGARILRRHLLPIYLFARHELYYLVLLSFLRARLFWCELELRGYSIPSIARILFLFLCLPVNLVLNLGLATLRAPVDFARTVYNGFIASSLQTQGLQQQIFTLDVRCVSWMIQASWDNSFHLTALKYLMVMPENSYLDRSLVNNCFDIFIGCINVADDRPVVVRGLEQLAELSASCFLRTFHHFHTTDPTSSALARLRHRYARFFSSGWVDFGDLTFRYTMLTAQVLVNHSAPPKEWKWWNDDGPFTEEHIRLAACIEDVAQVKYQQTRRRKVPRWTLRFALESLSLDPPPPPIVIADCLKIIAIDLGCDVSNFETASVQVLSNTIIQKLETMVGSPTINPTYSRKAISTLLPYAISLEQSGDQRMVDAIIRVARTLDLQGFTLRYIEPSMAILFNKPTAPSLNRAATLLSPYVPWEYWDKNIVAMWAAAVSAVPYSEEVGWSVVDTLLQIATMGYLRPHIPRDIWVWLKKSPSLPPVCKGRYRGTGQDLVRHVREFGDPDILKSYFLLVWSEWDVLRNAGFAEMQVSIVKDLGGIRMQRHRKDLIERLDYVLGELDRGLGRHNLRLQEADVQMGKEQYRILRDLLLRADREAMESPAESHST